MLVVVGHGLREISTSLKQRADDADDIIAKEVSDVFDNVVAEEVSVKIADETDTPIDEGGSISVE